jgi:dipeptidyl-peptidase 4
MVKWLLFASTAFLVPAVAPLLQPARAMEAPVGGGSVTPEAYRRAEAVLPQHVDELVFMSSVRPQWFEKSNRFWYERSTPAGREYVLVDPLTRRSQPLFDHEKLRADLGRVTERRVQPRDLRLRSAELSKDQRSLEFGFADKRWRLSLADGRLTERAKKEPLGLLSPDGRLRAFSRGSDLWIADVETGAERRLTTDGTAARPYARPVVNVKKMIGEGTSEPELEPDIAWSPDSRRIATYRLDLTGARRLAIVQSTPPKGAPPKVFDYYYTLTGDDQTPLATDVIIDVTSGAVVKSKAKAEPILYYGGPSFEWSKDGSSVFERVPARGYKTMRLDRIDAITGDVTTLHEDRSDTYVDYYGHHWSYDEDRDRHFWTADKTGFAHVYRVDGATGRTTQLTRGDWRARSVAGSSPDGSTVFIVGSGRETGRDPYLRSLYAVAANGRGLRALTPEPLDHDVSVSPDGRFFVDNMSLVDKPTVSVLRSAEDGRIVMELGRADITRFEAAGYRLPEAFEAFAADGRTKIYGAVFKPADFDPSKKYPVIEYTYTGPHYVQTPKTFEAGLLGRTAMSMAQLGAIGVTVDGRGTWGRSRAFQQVAYKNLHEVGLDDHIAAIRSLAAKHQWIDADRVGIYGFSAGGYDVVRAMTRRPEFYKVGVSASGNHDNRLDKATWNEQWMDRALGAVYDENSNVTWAPKLTGDLMLAHGELDENVPVAATLRLVDALMKANKDFDFLIVPNADHFLDDSPYFQRRRWDFFSEKLLGRTPPKAYKMRPFGE